MASTLEGVVARVSATQVELVDDCGQHHIVTKANRQALYGLRPFGACVTIAHDHGVATTWRPSYPGRALAAVALQAGGGATPAEAQSIVRHFHGMLRDVFLGDARQILAIQAAATRLNTEDAAWRERLARILSTYVHAVGPVFAALLVQEAQAAGVTLDQGLALQIDEAFDQHEPAVVPGDRLKHFRQNPWLPYLYRFSPSDLAERQALRAFVDAMAAHYRAAGSIPNYDEARVLGAVARRLSQHMTAGHSYAVRAVGAAARDLGMSAQDVHAMLTPDTKRNNGWFMRKTDMPDLDYQGRPIIGLAVAFKRLFFAEKYAADTLVGRLGALVTPLAIRPALSGEQARAALTIGREGLSVVTGPAGSGKTHLLGAVARVAAQKHFNVAVLATTGVAAQRLGHAAGLPGRTLHSFIGMVPGVPKLHPPASSLEPIDLMIVDESSMLDSYTLGKLAYFLTKYNVHVRRLCLAGDAHQLPPVSPGKPFRDLLDHLPGGNVARLSQNHRTRAAGIVQFARHVAQGGPLADAVQFGPDVTTHAVTTAADVWPIVAQMAATLGVAPELLGVVSPRYDGPLGVHALNEMLRHQLNPSAQGMFWPGDRVVQLHNRVMPVAGSGDLTTVWNGMIGDIQNVLANGFLEVEMDGTLVAYSPEAALRDLAYGWALTVHKSQGGQYPGTVFVFDPDARLSRELAYTALTRAADRLAVATAPGALAQVGALVEDTPRRYGFFADYLRQASPSQIAIP